MGSALFFVFTLLLFRAPIANNLAFSIAASLRSPLFHRHCHWLSATTQLPRLPNMGLSENSVPQNSKVGHRCPDYVDIWECVYMYIYCKSMIINVGDTWGYVYIYIYYVNRCKALCSLYWTSHSCLSAIPVSPILDRAMSMAMRSLLL